MVNCQATDTYVGGFWLHATPKKGIISSNRTLSNNRVVYMVSGEYGGFNPRKKTTQELAAQLQSTQEQFSPNEDADLVVSSVPKESIIDMPLAEIKNKFPVRYDFYLKLLRQQRAKEKNGAERLTDKDVGSMRKWLAALNSVDAYIQNHREGIEDTLKDRQMTVFEDMRDYLEKGGRAGYIKLPTGVGKTVLFTEFVEALDLKTLIVVPSTMLIDQTEEKMARFAPDIDYGTIDQYAKQHGRQVTITTYDSLVSQLRKGAIKAEDYDCIILDEAHKGLGPERTAAIAHFNNAIKLGFTATPDYSHDKKLSALLPDKIHSMEIPEAVSEGLLAPYSVIKVEVKGEAGMIIDELPLDENGEYDQKTAEKIVNIASRNVAAVEVYENNFKGQLALAYCAGINHAKAVAKEFVKKGIYAAVISGTTSISEKRRLKEAFHNRQIAVLCNADLLITGFDEPRVNVVMNLRLCRSRVAVEQMCGRALRLDPENPNKRASIVEFVDKNIPEDKQPVSFADLDSAFGKQRSKNLSDDMRGGGSEGLSRRPLNLLVDVSGLEVVFNMKEIARVTRQLRAIPNELKPYIKTIDGLSEELKVSANTIQAFLRELKQKDPEKYDKWVAVGALNSFILHPDLSAFLREKYKDYATSREKISELKRQGYKTIKQIRTEHGAIEGTIKDMIELYFKEFPDRKIAGTDVVNATIFNGLPATFCSPAIQSFINERLAPNEAPSQWKNTTEVAQMVGVGGTAPMHIKRSLEKIAATLIAKGVSPADLYLDVRKKGLPTRVYSPRVIKRFITERSRTTARYRY